MSKILDIMRGLTGNASTADITVTNTTPQNDATQKVATTAWCAFGFEILKAAPGYIKLPDWLGGLIFQWGVASSVSAGGSVLVTLPKAFPTALLCGGATINTGTTTSVGNYSAYISLTSATQIRVWNDDNVTSGAVAQNVAWWCIGH